MTAAAVSAVLVSGCSGGAPAPTGGTGDPADTTPPAITHPLPATVISGDPCGALTTAQTTTLLGSTDLHVEKEDNTVAVMCHWSNMSRGSQITVQYLYGWTRGLGTVYAKRHQIYFREMGPVQGYPTVEFGWKFDHEYGRCGIAVGVAENTAFEADATISRELVGHLDPCDAADRIADAVLTTMTSTP
ncbi:DUF3558 domain-containing protein [Amycolatopsis sp. PS_44_ISF1]|uniref:DUF3558 domain-containing protein n=1 Tax=Amycolatopsis sp. PS_44_ISF1 TaxID=2974917 RepID=UPI0028DF56FA|nr:DUF3558 domain-containing protein [Amycolatopsis sp. PS_44_ISF1]MDT8913550.1 DUF3558 domain-containing protein [Amycolatopsis sp. PS_44_ISF1]